MGFNFHSHQINGRVKGRLTQLPQVPPLGAIVCCVVGDSLSVPLGCSQALWSTSCILEPAHVITLCPFTHTNAFLNNSAPHLGFFFPVLWNPCTFSGKHVFNFDLFQGKGFLYNPL